MARESPLQFNSPSHFNIPIFISLICPFRCFPRPISLNFGLPNFTPELLSDCQCSITYTRCNRHGSCHYKTAAARKTQVPLHSNLNLHLVHANLFKSILNSSK
uniref:Microfibrillar-associated protein 1 n=1 Tax=Rhizophora mucronata TaxID=61149 RepID=A0A2P2NFG3_RHIMU